MMFVNTLQM